jgi:hypothetical protein
MWLFDIFKKTENVYYRDFKKTIINLDKDKKTTVSSLRTRVMTISNTIETLNKDLETLKRTHLCDKLSEKIDDLELKIKVMEKILEESKIDFVNGVSIKYRSLYEGEIPLNYNKCLNVSYMIERKFHLRHISTEEIKDFNSMKVI